MNLVETITCYDACKKLLLAEEAVKLQSIINIILDKTLTEATKEQPDADKTEEKAE